MDTFSWLPALTPAAILVYRRDENCDETEKDQNWNDNKKEKARIPIVSICISMSTIRFWKLFSVCKYGNFGSDKPLNMY